MSRSTPTPELIAGFAAMPDYGASVLAAMMTAAAGEYAAGPYAALGGYRYCAELAAGVIAHLAREQRGGAGLICLAPAGDRWNYYAAGEWQDAGALDYLTHLYPAAVVMQRRREDRHLSRPTPARDDR